MCEPNTRSASNLLFDTFLYTSHIVFFIDHLIRVICMFFYISISHYLNECNLYNDMSNFNFLKVAEITRVLRSGGVFVGTTFLRYTSSTSWIVRPFREVNSL